MRRKSLRFITIFSILAIIASLQLALVPALSAQTPETAYKPKFAGDPARSDSEAAALAYMRVVLRAQRLSLIHIFERLIRRTKGIARCTTRS